MWSVLSLQTVRHLLTWFTRLSPGMDKQRTDRQTDRQLFFKGNGPYLTLVISSYPDDLVKAPTPNLANVRATV